MTRQVILKQPAEGSTYSEVSIRDTPYNGSVYQVARKLQEVASSKDGSWADSYFVATLESA